jgi:tetratricopeptide (TPR) repeat protein
MDLSGDDLGDIEQNHKTLTGMGIRLAEKENKPEEALRCFELLLAQDPWDALSLNNKAHCLRALERVEEARSSAIASITIEPRLLHGWCTLGEIQLLAGERVCARLSFDQALKLTEDPSTADTIREFINQC